MENRSLWAIFICILALACGGASDGDGELGRFGEPDPMIDRVKASGWAAFEVLTDGQMNQLDLNQTAMADGRYVPDYFWALNFTPPFALDLRNGAYDPIRKRWVMVGGTSGSPACRTTFDFRLFTAGGAMPGGGGYITRAMAASSTGTVLAVGDSSAAKIRRTVDGGSNWTAVTVAADADAGNDWTNVVWHELSKSFIAGGQPGKLWVSFDEGQNWQEVALPSAWSSRIVDSIASNGELLVAMPRKGGSPQQDYLATTNPLVWQERTFPQTALTSCVAWSEHSRAFIAPGQPTLIGDGSSWVPTSNVPSLSADPGACATMQDVVMVTGDDGVVHISVNGGIQWHRVLDAPSGQLFFEIAAGNGRLVVFSSAGTASRATLGSVFDG